MRSATWWRGTNCVIEPEHILIYSADAHWIIWKVQSSHLYFHYKLFLHEFNGLRQISDPFRCKNLIHLSKFVVTLKSTRRWYVFHGSAIIAQPIIRYVIMFCVHTWWSTDTRQGSCHNRSCTTCSCRQYASHLAGVINTNYISLLIAYNRQQARCCHVPTLYSALLTVNTEYRSRELGRKIEYLTC